MNHDALNEILLLLALAVLAVALLRRIHLPPILAYLLVGVLAGPHALGWLEESPAVELLAEIGVAFLLFMIGLEISIPRLLSMKGVVLGLGGAQVVLTALSVTLLAHWLGLEWGGAFVVGGALAMSSTAIVVKQLNEQLEIHSRHGRIALGILLFQDLAVVPLLVVIPILASPEGALLLPLLFALAKGVIAFVTLFLVGRWLLRPLFHLVAESHSAELFTLTVLLVSLAAAGFTAMLGLSLALGAFLAGMTLGETEYRHQIEADIRPFRDVLMGLFFISIGLKLDLMALPENWLPVLLLLLLLIPGKGLLIYALSRLGGYEPGVAMRAGTVLAQGGEFGFAIMALAMASSLLAPGQTQAILAAVILSMAVAPLLVRHNGHLAKRVCAASYLGGRQRAVEELRERTGELDGHVVLCGFGRIGQNLARFLRLEGIPYVALELDPTLLREAREAGEEIHFGDATHGEILDAVGLGRARALVVTFAEGHAAEKVVIAARRINLDAAIVVRIRDDSWMERLEQAGATDVVPEAIEAAMMLASHLLQHLGVAGDEINRLVEQARHDHYRKLRAWFHGEEEVDIEQKDRSRLHSVLLPDGGAAVGRKVGELGMERLGAEVLAVRRGMIRGEDPSPDMELRAGDVLVLRGDGEALEHAEERLLGG